MIPIRPSALASAPAPIPPVDSGAVPLPSDSHYAALHAYRRAAQVISDKNAGIADAEAHLRSEHRDALAAMQAVRPGFDPRDPSTFGPVPRVAGAPVPEDHRQALAAMRAINPYFDLSDPSTHAMPLPGHSPRPAYERDGMPGSVTHAHDGIPEHTHGSYFSTRAEDAAAEQAGQAHDAALARVLQTAPDGAHAADAHDRAFRHLRATVRAARLYRNGVQAGRASVVDRDMHAAHRNAVTAMQAIHPPFNPDDRATWGVPPSFGTRHGGRVGEEIEKGWANRSTPGSRTNAEEARDPRGRWTAGGVAAQGRSDAQDGPGERWRLSNSSPHALVHNQLITIRPEDGHVRFGNDARSPFHDPEGDDFHARVMENLNTLGVARGYGPDEDAWHRRRIPRVGGAATSGTGDVISHRYLAGSTPQIPRGAFSGAQPRRQTFPEALIGEAPPPPGTTEPAGLAAVNRKYRGDELSVGYESHPTRAALRHTDGPGVPLTVAPSTYVPGDPGSHGPRYTINHMDLARRFVTGLHAQAIAEAAEAARERHLAGPAWAGVHIAKSRQRPVPRRQAATFVRDLVRRAMGA